VLLILYSDPLSGERPQVTMPTIYVIGGANGSGKTTVALELLPTLGVLEYVNADAIATGLSPFNPESMNIQAGRLMLQRIEGLSKAGADFAFETTLAARTFAPFLRNCKAKSYIVNLLYFWLSSPDLAVQRVAWRVASGGHSIPEAVIRRRYERGRRNLFELYLPLCDGWIVYDNSGVNLKMVAQRERDGQTIVNDLESWRQITERSNV
jgi:predicted ABC-type ATPase